ncbi:Chitinase, GH18 family [Chitinispirillum alkaliphilum]|nr:Chitinase, GH18 family [Chitinispirillum alkaliphilum]
MKTGLFVLVALLFSTVYSAETKVVGYYYAIDSSAIKTYDFSKLTHIVASFVTAAPDGTIIFDRYIGHEPYIKMVTEKARSEGAIPMISLGTTSGAWEMTKNAHSRAKFIEEIIYWCVENDISGIDLDLEGFSQEFSSGNEPTFFPYYYELLSNELRAAMPDSMILTAAVGASTWNGSQWTDGLLANMDFINVMVYDLALSWVGTPVVNHSTFDHHTTAAQYWHYTRGIPKEKIVMGLPFYARGWDRDNNVMYTENSPWGAVRGFNYNDLVNRFSIPAHIDTIDLYPDTTILFPRSDGVVGTSTLFFNNIDMVRRKTEWTIENGYGGMMFWEIPGDLPYSDERSLIRAVYHTLYPENSIHSSTNLSRFDKMYTVTDNNIIYIRGLQSNHNIDAALFALSGRKLRLSRLIKQDSQIAISLNECAISTGLFLLRIRDDTFERTVPVLIGK